MKRQVLFLFLFLFLINCFAQQNEYEIWGVWNLGSEEQASIRFGEYLVTRNFLFFESSYNGYGDVIGYGNGLF